MREFVKSHKKLLIIIIVAFVLCALLTTAGIAAPGIISDRNGGVSVCSVPTGKAVAKGIDVSRYQGDIDFRKVREDGYSFVILRIGTTQGGKDERFDAYYDSAAAAGLDIGCYYYTYSSTEDGALQEARDVLSYIGGRSLSYPVFYDFEYPELLVSSRVGENTAMINAFCTEIKAGGYYPGVYLSSSVYDDCIDSEELGNKWDFWVAAYLDHTDSYDGYSRSFSMWQYTNTGRVSGIDEDVDLDVSYVDYPGLTSDFYNKIHGLS